MTYITYHFLLEWPYNLPQVWPKSLTNCRKNDLYHLPAASRMTSITYNLPQEWPISLNTCFKNDLYHLPLASRMTLITSHLPQEWPKSLIPCLKNDHITFLKNDLYQLQLASRMTYATYHLLQEWPILLTTCFKNDLYHLPLALRMTYIIYHLPQEWPMLSLDLKKKNSTCLTSEFSDKLVIIGQSGVITSSQSSSGKASTQVSILSASTVYTMGKYLWHIHVNLYSGTYIFQSPSDQKFLLKISRLWITKD